MTRIDTASVISVSLNDIYVLLIFDARLSSDLMAIESSSLSCMTSTGPMLDVTLLEVN